MRFREPPCLTSDGMMPVKNRDELHVSDKRLMAAIQMDMTLVILG